MKLTFFLLLLLPVGFMTSAALVHHQYWSSPFTDRTAKLESSAVEKAATLATEEDVPQVVSLQVTPSGFEPRETIASKGKFLILVQNRTGRRDLNFWLARENQERLAESKSQKRDWDAQVQLAPGTYIVGETDHPEWQSIIRVTN